MKKLFIVAVFSFLLSACGQSDGASTPSGADEKDGKIKIVAVENFYGEVAEAVGGDNVQVISILNDAVMDPEDFTPSTQNAKDINDAGIVVYNGLGYDAWASKLLSTSKRDTRKEIAVGSDLLGLKNGDNPHVWYDVDAMPKLADALAEALAAIDPESADNYRANARNYRDTLAPFLQKVDALKQDDGVPVEITETIFEYMAEKINLVPQTPDFATAVFNGVDPSPADLIQMEQNLKEKKAKMLIYNARKKNQDVDRFMQMAKDAGIPVVAVTEQMPEGKTYLTWMMDQLNELEKALNERRS
ncbi:MAG TPA: zinc ABC transporter substrate-binding protein [Paenibacillus sp.]|uniref:metal ABC transporter solute-binding protein, Zn/Mn family n=1 Tax=Paenibacillus sp. TaxID=58172 RepID=UPI0028D6CB18|nr:zinc ABC transporter substrate-binding protein [Paenibacillus sp.]HUC93761.1 zinc ABC transporter substrate-binding protein [Paenibacillus sp.]